MQNRFFFIISLIALICANTVQSQTIERIVIQGNKQTQSQVILNELGVSEGDNLPEGGFDQWAEGARQRLQNTSLFVSLSLGYEIAGDNIVLIVHVQERWYYWVYPILEHADRNFASFLNSRDWQRLNYGLSFEKHNFRGRNEFLKFKMRFGYRSQLGFMYDNPAIDKNRQQGIQISADRFQQSKILYTIDDNFPVYRFDEANNLLSENRFRMIYHYRPNLYSRIKFMAEYRDYYIGDGLDTLAPDYLFQHENQSRFLSFYLKYESDFRNIKYYPTDGYYFSASVEKHGIGAMRSEINLLIARLNFDFYQPIASNLSWASEAYFSTHLINENHIPFLFAGMIGYDYYPRGYEYRMVLGNAVYGLNETVRYNVFQSDAIFDEIIPIQQFKPFAFSVYCYGFFDMAYVDNQLSFFEGQSLENQLLYSGGLGVDFVTYYDRSIGFHFAVTNQKAFGIFATLRSPIYKTF
jgi:outer membrane protein assembly factor BamA